MDTTRQPTFADLQEMLGYDCAGLETAFEVGKKAHFDQKRKYLGTPYFWHPMDVARRVRETAQDLGSRGHLFVFDEYELPCMLQAALLHDTIEDTDLSFTDLEKALRVTERSTIIKHVYFLSDLVPHAKGNRATRRRLADAHIAAAPFRSQLIKVCDIGSNLESIIVHDRKFAMTYIPEKKATLEEIAHAWNWEMDFSIEETLAFKSAWAIIEQWEAGPHDE